MPTGRNAEMMRRFAAMDDNECSDCHSDFFERKPMFHGLDQSQRENHDEFRQALTWDFIRRVKGVTSMKVVVKGVVTREDAEHSLASGADGVIVSNHGGRASGSARGTMEALPEVAETIAGRIPVLLDGGVRRGADVFKALALGADAVSIGRPYVWGLASFGSAGVKAVLRMLDQEFEREMKSSGVTTVAQIDGSFVTKRG